MMRCAACPPASFGPIWTDEYAAAGGTPSCDHPLTCCWDADAGCAVYEQAFQGIPDGAEEAIPSFDMVSEGRVEGIGASVIDGAGSEPGSGDEGTRAASPSVLIEGGDDEQGQEQDH